MLHATSWLSDRGGGVPPVIWGFSREMGKLGVDSVVAGLSDDPTETQRLMSGATILAGKGANAFGYSPELRRRIFSNLGTVSLIHTHGLWMHPGVVARKAAAAAAVPLVVSAHGMLENWALKHSAWKKRLAGWLFENKNLRAAACLHALCETEAKSYRNYGLSNPICVVPNGVDLPASGPGKPEIGKPPWEGVIEPGRKVLLYLGRIHPKKGLMNLLRAWSVVRSHKSADWVLAIAGWDQGGHEPELKRQCDEFGIAWRDVRTGGTTGQQDNRTTGPKSVVRGPWSVVFLGPQFGDARAVCYHHCDAFILPSFSEGLPMVVLEAWAYSKPVLMTPQCNLPEGFASAAAVRIESNVESIANHLREFYAMPESTLQQMGQAGRALVSRRFNWTGVAGEMFQVYQWLLGNGAKPECVV